MSDELERLARRCCRGLSLRGAAELGGYLIGCDPQQPDQWQDRLGSLPIERWSPQQLGHAVLRRLRQSTQTAMRQVHDHWWLHWRRCERNALFVWIDAELARADDGPEWAPWLDDVCHRRCIELFGQLDPRHEVDQDTDHRELPGIRLLRSEELSHVLDVAGAIGTGIAFAPADDRAVAGVARVLGEPLDRHVIWAARTSRKQADEHGLQHDGLARLVRRRFPMEDQSRATAETVRYLGGLLVHAVDSGRYAGDFFGIWNQLTLRHGELIRDEYADPRQRHRTLRVEAAIGAERVLSVAWRRAMPAR